MGSDLDHDRRSSTSIIINMICPLAGVQARRGVRVQQVGGKVAVRYKVAGGSRRFQHPTRGGVVEGESRE